MPNKNLLLIIIGSIVGGILFLNKINATNNNELPETALQSIVDQYKEEGLHIPTRDIHLETINSNMLDADIKQSNKQLPSWATIDDVYVDSDSMWYIKGTFIFYGSTFTNSRRNCERKINCKSKNR